jgi:hypothetical protein
MPLKASAGANFNVNPRKRPETNTYKLPSNPSDPNKLRKLLTTI